MAVTEGRDKYSHLRKLTDQELKTILCADFETGQDNTDAILYILEVLEERAKANDADDLPDVDEAYATFKAKYDTDEGRGRSLYPLGDDRDDAPQSNPRTRKQNKSIWKIIAVAACLTILLLPPAMGYSNIFVMLAEWSETSFRLTQSQPSPSNSPHQNESATNSTESYDSIQEALSAYGISGSVVPTWFPDGFECRNVSVQSSLELGEVYFNAFYQDGKDDSISLSYILRTGTSSREYEKDKESVQIYEARGITHYIYENNGKTVSTWYTDGLECSISAGISLESTKKMIDSIYERSVS